MTGLDNTLDKVVDLAGNGTYLVGNGTYLVTNTTEVMSKTSGLISQVSGVISNANLYGSVTALSLKTASRLIRAAKSFKRAGLYSPSFYMNSAATGCSGVSLVLRTSSMLVPPLSIQLYAASQFFSGAADTIDECCGWSTVFF